MSTIDAALLKKMFLAGVQALEAKKEWINELNVFPVPDGDTGTNMVMTIWAAAKEVMASEDEDMDALAKAISSGSLRGARGNSGVILSQLFRGFTRSIKGKKELSATDLAEALKKGTETAYKAVMKPKEGTILTVAKGLSDKAEECAKENLELADFLNQVLLHGDYVLSQTPEMLPVLKQAGVVDSGGQGLMVVLHGAYDVFCGKEVDLSAVESVEVEKKPAATMDKSSIDTAHIKFGYCTEFIILLDKEFTEQDEDAFKEYLSSIGDSLVCVADDEVVKVHVHTNDPGLAIQRGLSYGQLTKMKIDNMREEHQERVIKDAEKLAAQQLEEQSKAPKRKDVGFVAVSVGAGLSEIFTGLGADYMIEGGQTMNPSTEDMLEAIAQVNADTVFVFPNNKNIILAANQAASLVEDKNVIVIPSKTVPQGINALINYVPEMSPEENAVNMEAEMKRVKTVQVTYAVRDTTIDGIEIHDGDIMALGDHGILSAGKDVAAVSREAVKNMLNHDSELVSIYYGEDIDEETAQALATQIRGLNSDIEVDVNYGGQPIYYYLISVE